MEGLWFCSGHISGLLSKSPVLVHPPPSSSLYGLVTLTLRWLISSFAPVIITLATPHNKYKYYISATY